MDFLFRKKKKKKKKHSRITGFYLTAPILGPEGQRTFNSGYEINVH